MICWIKEVYKASAPVRAIYHVIAIVSIIFTVLSAAYYGFFDHRTWITERIAERYSVVEEKQTEVLELIVRTVPSRANNDASPSPQQVAALQTALIQLSGTVTQVDIVSEQMAVASDQYRASIADLTGALVRFDPSVPSSQGALLQAVDRWDVAARTFANAVEAHIGSFSRTLPSSV